MINCVVKHRLRTIERQNIRWVSMHYLPFIQVEKSRWLFDGMRRSRIKDSINWPLFSSAETCRIDIERLIYTCTPPAQLSCVSQFTRPTGAPHSWVRNSPRLTTTLRALSLVPMWLLSRALWTNGDKVWNTLC